MANRPKQAAYAPGSPMAAFAVESVIDDLCKALGLDPIEVRHKMLLTREQRRALDPNLTILGIETLEAAKSHNHYNTPLKKARQGISCGFGLIMGEKQLCLSHFQRMGPLKFRLVHLTSAVVVLQWRLWPLKSSAFRMNIYVAQ